MTTGSRAFAIIAITASMVQAAGAVTPAPVPACITPAELRAGVAFMVPTMVRGVRAKCTSVLPGNAYLNRQGDALISRFAAPGLSSPVALNSLIGKISPSPDIPASANGAMAEVIGASLVARMQQSLKLSSCPALDLTLALLDPLPAENIVGLLALIGTEVTRGDARKGRSKGAMNDIQLCESMK